MAWPWVQVMDDFTLHIPGGLLQLLRLSSPCVYGSDAIMGLLGLLFGQLRRSTNELELAGWCKNA